MKIGYWLYYFCIKVYVVKRLWDYYIENYCNMMYYSVLE